MTRRTAAALTALLMGIALPLQACGSTPAPDHPTQEASVNVQDRPSMEHMLKHYRDFQKTLFDELSARFGHRDWKPIPGSPGELRSACEGAEADSGGETVALPSMTFAGSYPAGDDPAIMKLVRQVGKRFGFTHVSVISDEPGNLDFRGFDKYGGNYEYGNGSNTIFGIITGCHVWDDPPSPES